MIKTVNRSINKLSNKVGISCNIPLPSKKSLEVSQCTNAVVATACLVLSVPFSSKIVLSIGVLSAISIVVTQIEKKECDF